MIEIINKCIQTDFVPTLVANMRPFHIINAEKTIIARFNSWNVSCRLFAQSFLSSRTCLSIISLIMLLLFLCPGVFIVEVRAGYCMQRATVKRNERMEDAVVGEYGMYNRAEVNSTRSS